MNCTELSKSWEDKAERLRKAADKTLWDEPAEAYLAEAQTLEVCADQLNRAIKED